MMKNNKVKYVGWGVLFGIGALMLAALMALLFGWVLMLLWNWLMPEIFGLPMIGYWQAWGLILLSHLLFKGGGHGPSGRRNRHFSPGHGRRPGRGGGPCSRHDHGEFDDFKKEFKDRMKARWHDYDDSEDTVIPEDKED